MKWQYKTILFEFRKDGLLSGQYIDDEEVEAELNEMGDQGWELVTVSMVPEGLLAFCKLAVSGAVQPVQPAQPVRSQLSTTVNIPKSVPEPVKTTNIRQQARQQFENRKIQQGETMSGCSGDGVGDIKIS